MKKTKMRRFNPNLFTGGVDPNNPVPANNIPVEQINERFKQRLQRERLIRSGVPVIRQAELPQRFKTQDEHNNFYIKRALEYAKVNNPDKYELYFKYLNDGDKDGALSVLAILGSSNPEIEIPQFDPTRIQPNPTGPSRILDIGHGMPNVGGYRYNRGPGLPARGSITNRRRRRNSY